MLNNMKTKILIIVIAITLGLTFTGNAQDIDVNNIALMSPANISQGVLLGDPISKATGIFGQPTSIVDQNFEMQNVTAKVYTYGNNKLYFVNGLLDSYSLFDASIIVGTINGTTFKIGDKILTRTITRTQPRGAPEKTYIKSFLNFTLILAPDQGGVINGLNYTTLTNSSVKKNNAYIDMVFGLLFDSNDFLVKISVNEP